MKRSQWFSHFLVSIVDWMILMALYTAARSVKIPDQIQYFKTKLVLCVYVIIKTKKVHLTLQYTNTVERLVLLHFLQLLGISACIFDTFSLSYSVGRFVLRWAGLIWSDLVWSGLLCWRLSVQLIRDCQSKIRALQSSSLAVWKASHSSTRSAPLQRRTLFLTFSRTQCLWSLSNPPSLCSRHALLLPLLCLQWGLWVCFNLLPSSVVNACPGSNHFPFHSLTQCKNCSCALKQSFSRLPQCTVKKK